MNSIYLIECYNYLYQIGWYHFIKSSQTFFILIRAYFYIASAKYFKWLHINYYSSNKSINQSTVYVSL